MQAQRHGQIANHECPNDGYTQAKQRPDVSHLPPSGHRLLPMARRCSLAVNRHIRNSLTPESGRITQRDRDSQGDAPMDSNGGIDAEAKDPAGPPHHTKRSHLV
jgi:hypothetical protein